MLSVKNKLH